MSIRHLNFHRHVEEENITKAAKKLYLAQPTVSVAIKEIERAFMGQDFFERINQRLHITEKESSSSGTVFPAIGCSGAHMAVYFS